MLLQRVRTLLATALLFPILSAGSSAQEARATGELRLRPGDAIRVAVRDEPGLSGEFPVNEAGTTLLPLAGLVEVAGRPFQEVRSEVASRLGALLVDPEILVMPLVRIAVLGEVYRPGLFPVDATHTVGDALAAVGGLTPLADRGRVTMVRDGEARPVRLDPGSPDLEAPLRSGDQIVVGRRGWFREHLAIFVGAAASVAAAAATALLVR